LHNEELHILHASRNIIRQIRSRRMRRAGACGTHRVEGKLYRVLVGKPEERRPLPRPRRRWEDGIRRDLKEIG
jgi:hypothetical protein